MFRVADASALRIHRRRSSGKTEANGQPCTGHLVFAIINGAMKQQGRGDGETGRRGDGETGRRRRQHRARRPGYHAGGGQIVDGAELTIGSSMTASCHRSWPTRCGERRPGACETGRGTGAAVLIAPPLSPRSRTLAAASSRVPSQWPPPESFLLTGMSPHEIRDASIAILAKSGRNQPRSAQHRQSAHPGPETAPVYSASPPPGD